MPKLSRRSLLKTPARLRNEHHASFNYSTTIILRIFSTVLYLRPFKISSHQVIAHMPGYQCYLDLVCFEMPLYLLNTEVKISRPRAVLTYFPAVELHHLRLAMIGRHYGLTSRPAPRASVPT